jgi:Domain of unknown function (DUF4166)
MNLYRRIIGSAWSNLAEPVQRFHLIDGEVCFHGNFSVGHGTNFLARLLVRLLQMPDAGQNLNTCLVVTALADGERWRRTFGESDFVTEQHECDGNLHEYLGMMEFCFHLDVFRGVLIYQHSKTALRFGSLRVPLPRLLAPRIVASEWAPANESRVHGSVRVTAPIIGLLITYKGYLETKGAVA